MCGNRNINIFRDSRWGRGSETYGEDPTLTSQLGVAFVRGLQGNHSIYKRVIATPKHYTGYSVEGMFTSNPAIACDSRQSSDRLLV